MPLPPPPSSWFELSLLGTESLHPPSDCHIPRSSVQCKSVLLRFLFLWVLYNGSLLDCRLNGSLYTRSQLVAHLPDSLLPWLSIAFQGIGYTVMSCSCRWGEWGRGLRQDSDGPTSCCCPFHFGSSTEAGPLGQCWEKALSRDGFTQDLGEGGGLTMTYWKWSCLLTVLAKVQGLSV